MKSLHSLAFILLIIGGFNWLLVGLFTWDIGVLFGGMAAGVSRLIYVLVGLSALLELFNAQNWKRSGPAGVPGQM